MFCLLDQDLLFWIVSSGFQKNRLFCFPFELHLVFSNSMAEQTPEQSVYGIPDFAFKLGSMFHSGAISGLAP